ncbi:hypothetical protein BDW22DRAFT_1362497 [Trametopsis cervina]|nr:hypothetical protein BDW22DRAFT_1362497 [Trametopsis cervina]
MSGAADVQIDTKKTINHLLPQPRNGSAIAPRPISYSSQRSSWRERNQSKVRSPGACFAMFRQSRSRRKTKNASAKRAKSHSPNALTHISTGVVYASPGVVNIPPCVLHV